MLPAGGLTVAELRRRPLLTTAFGGGALLALSTIPGEWSPFDPSQPPTRGQRSKTHVAVRHGVIGHPVCRTGGCARAIGACSRARCSARSSAPAASSRAWRAAAALTLTALRGTPSRRARFPARRFGMIGRLVDRLEVTLVLELPTSRGNVGVPALGRPPAGQLHIALVKRRLDLQSEHLLLNVEDHSRHATQHVTEPSTRYCGLPRPARRPRSSGPRPRPGGRTSYPAVRVSAQYIFTMHRLSKLHPPDEDEILTILALAFYPGAKIGVLGYNGAGESTLLHIIAGVDSGLSRRGGTRRAPASGCSSESRG